MRIVLASQSLAGLGGSETYVVTVADHLQRLGHDVWLHALDHGTGSDHARSLGVRVAERPEQLPPDPEAIVVQDGAVAALLAERHPSAPQVFVAHSDVFDLQLPLGVPGLTAAVVALYDRVEQRVRAHSGAPRVVRLSQPIDVERFKPRSALPQRPRVALTFGNYVHGGRLELLRQACERAGLELRHVGGYGSGTTSDPAGVLNEADVVFGKARVVLEAMACGRAVYVFDHNGAEGWVTDADRGALAADNFGGQSAPIEIDADRLAADLARYDAASGLANRDFVVARHAATKHAAALVELLREVAAAPPAAPPADAPLRELARIVRLHHRADTQAFLLHAELERRDLALRERGDELHAARVDADAARAEAAAAREQAAAAREAAAGAEQARVDAERSRADAEQRAGAAAHDAESARAELVRLYASPRWRLASALLAPVDRLRARRGRRGRTEPAGPPAAPAPAPVRPAPAPPAQEAAAPAPSRSPAPAAATPAPRPAEAHPPAPFVVGVARSGTTLLRLQLDAHPQLAIPPETGFGALAGRLRAAAGPDAFAAAVRSLETWPDLGIDDDALAALLAGVSPWTPGDALRALYAGYAARHGKPRFGDKTPGHLRQMEAIAELLPEARFIHIVRDGRDVAASLREQPFAPGDGSAAAAAAHWRDELLAARATAARLPRYREVSYERLVREPEATLRELCDFAGLPFDAALLRAHERASLRFEELPERRPSGDGFATRAERAARHARTAQPPDAARIGRWRETLDAEEAAAVEQIAGPLLAELGYAEAAT